MDDTEAALEVCRLARYFRRPRHSLFEQKRIDSLLEVKQWDEALTSLKEYQKFHGSSEAFALGVKAECNFRRGLQRAGKHKGRSLQSALPSGTSQGDFAGNAVRDLAAAIGAGGENGPTHALLAELLLFQLTRALLRSPGIDATGTTAAGSAAATPQQTISSSTAAAASAGASPASNSAQGPESQGGKAAGRSGASHDTTGGGAGTATSNGIDVLPTSLSSLCSTWNAAGPTSPGQGGLDSGSVASLSALLVHAAENPSSDVHAAFEAFQAAANQVPIPCVLGSDPSQMPPPLGVKGGAQPLKGVQLSQHRLWLWQRGLLLRAALHMAQWMQAVGPGADTPPLAPDSMPRALLLSAVCSLGVWQLCCVFAARTYRAVGDPGGVGGLVWQAWDKGLSRGALVQLEGGTASAAVSPLKSSPGSSNIGRGPGDSTPSWSTLQDRLHGLARGQGDLAWRSVLHAPVQWDNPCKGGVQAAWDALADGSKTPLDPLPAAWALPPSAVDLELLQRMGLRQQAAVGTALTSMATALLWGGKSLWAAHILSAALAGCAGVVEGGLARGAVEGEMGGAAKGAKGVSEGPSSQQTAATVPGFTARHGLVAEGIASHLLAGPYSSTRSSQLATGLLDPAAAVHSVSADQLALGWDAPLLTPLLAATGLVGGGHAGTSASFAGRLLALASAGGVQRGLFELGRTVAGLAGALLPRAVPFAGVFRRASVWRAVGLVCMGQFGAKEVGPLLEECAATSRHVTASTADSVQCITLADWQLTLLAAAVQCGALGRPAVARVLLNNATVAAGACSDHHGRTAAPRHPWWAHAPVPQGQQCVPLGMDDGVLSALGGLLDIEVSRRRGCLGGGGGAADIGGGCGVSALAAAAGGTSGSTHVDEQRALDAASELKGGYMAGAGALVGGGLSEATVSFSSALEAMSDGSCDPSEVSLGLLDATLAGAVWSTALAAAAVAGPTSDGVATAAAKAALSVAAGHTSLLAHAACVAEGAVSNAAVSGLVGGGSNNLSRAPLTLLALATVVDAAVQEDPQSTELHEGLWQLVQVMRATGLGPAAAVGGATSGDDGPMTVSPRELVAQCYASAATSLHSAAVAFLDVPSCLPGTLASLHDSSSSSNISGMAASGAAAGDTSGLPWIVTAAVHALCMHARSLIAPQGGTSPGPHLAGAPMTPASPKDSAGAVQHIGAPEALSAVARAEGLLDAAAGRHAGWAKPVLSSDAVASLMCTVGALHEVCGAPSAARAQFAAAASLSPGHAEAAVRCAWYAVHGTGVEGGGAPESTTPPYPPTCSDGASTHLVRVAQRVAPSSSLVWSLQSAVDSASGRDGTPAAVTAAKLQAGTPTIHSALPMGVKSVGQLLPPQHALRSYHAALCAFPDMSAVAQYTATQAQEVEAGNGGAL